MPPLGKADVGVVDVYADNDQLYAPNGAKVALWTAAGNPSEADCATLLASGGSDHTTRSIGSLVCGSTNGGHTILLKLLANSGYMSLTVHLIVWA
jgi:hypothetical protein